MNVEELDAIALSTIMLIDIAIVIEAYGMQLFTLRIPQLPVLSL